MTTHLAAITLWVRLSLALALSVPLFGCSFTHCTYWNVLPSLGIPYAPAVCVGGQPTQYVKPNLGNP